METKEMINSDSASEANLTRLTYVSKYEEENFDTPSLDVLIEKAVQNNEKMGITGFLVGIKGVFYQTIEGSEQSIGDLFGKISKDPRHFDVQILKREKIEKRMFPNWCMRRLNLDDKEFEMLADPIKVLLSTLSESHRILEKYTQPTVLAYLNVGIDPLGVKPRRMNKVIMFCDIMSFTTFSEKLDPETVASILNIFLEALTSSIRKYGGEVSKYIADCVLGYFEIEKLGASSAVKASIEILEKLENIRNNPPNIEGYPSSDPKHPLRQLYCGIGISLGSCVEGNIGSNSKKDFTIIGDSVNIAARLEAHTRETAHFMIFDENVKNNLNEKDLAEKTIFIGRATLKGKDVGIDIYSLDIPSNKKIPKLKESISAFLGSEIQQIQAIQKQQIIHQTSMKKKKPKSQNFLLSIFSCSSSTGDAQTPR